MFFALLHQIWKQNQAGHVEHITANEVNPPNPAASQVRCMYAHKPGLSKPTSTCTNQRGPSIDPKPQDPSSPGSCGVTVQTVTPLNPPKVPQKRPRDLVTPETGEQILGDLHLGWKCNHLAQCHLAQNTHWITYGFLLLCQRNGVFFSNSSFKILIHVVPVNLMTWMLKYTGNTENAMAMYSYC